jgi:hypothetical protein
MINKFKMKKMMDKEMKMMSYLKMKIIKNFFLYFLESDNNINAILDF